MGERYIKKIVRLSITKDEWLSNTQVGGNNLSFSVKGEVKNTGLSEVKSAVIIAAIIDAKTQKTYQIITRRLVIFKAADYSILPLIKPGQSVPFEVIINFPLNKSLLFGKWSFRNLEDDILKGKYRQNLYLLYDTRVLDEKTEQWFRDELLQNLKLINPKWEALYDKNKKLLGYKCTGQLKNISVKTIENFYIIGYIEDKYGKPIILHYNDEEMRIEGNQLISRIASHEKIKFEIVCRIPPEEILKENKLSLVYIKEKFSAEEFTMRITTMFSEAVLHNRIVYRDTEDAPTVIEEEVGIRKIEKIQEEWVFDQNNEEYTVSGIIKNTGEQDVENVYVMASIIDKEKNQPIVWETATDTLKTLVIEKIPYISVDEDVPIVFTLKLPSSKLFGKTRWNAKNIPESVESGELIRGVELYYVKEDVREEGLKRLRFGNSYFQLKNYRGCIREYLEGIKLIPDEKRLYFNLSLCYYKFEEIQKAFENCAIAIKLDPTYEKALYLMGLLNHYIEKYDEALKWYQDALKVNPENPRILYNIGCIYLKLDKLQQGFQFLHQAYIKDTTQVFSQLVRDPDFRKLKNNQEYLDFMGSIRREIITR